MQVLRPQLAEVAFDFMAVEGIVSQGSLLDVKVLIRSRVIGLLFVFLKIDIFYFCLPIYSVLLLAAVFIAAFRAATVLSLLLHLVCETRAADSLIIQLRSTGKLL